MTPQAARFLEKARKLLADADTMLGVGLNNASAALEAEIAAAEPKAAICG